MIDSLVASIGLTIVPERPGSTLFSLFLLYSPQITLPNWVFSFVLLLSRFVFSEIWMFNKAFCELGISRIVRLCAFMLFLFPYVGYWGVGVIGMNAVGHPSNFMPNCCV